MNLFHWKNGVLKMRYKILTQKVQVIRNIHKNLNAASNHFSGAACAAPVGIQFVNDSH